MRAKKELQVEARRLRKEGKSVNEIVTILGAAKSSVSLWVRDIELTGEQRISLKTRGRQYGSENAGAQVNIERFRVLRVKYQEGGRAKAKEQRSLHLAGCMLYWAEGSKNRHRVEFVNSSAEMLRFFIRFLREELNIKDENIKINIHCHTAENEKLQLIVEYWLNLLQLSSASLRKIYYKESGKVSRKRLEYGVCGIRVESTELVQHIFGAIQEYAGFDNPDWLF